MGWLAGWIAANLVQIADWASTSFRAFFLPVIFIAFVSFSRNLFVTPAKYGIGKPSPVKLLSDQLDRHSSKTLVLVNNGLGSEVNSVIADLEATVTGRGKVKVLEKEDDLRVECKQSLRGNSDCFAAVVFEGTPENGGRWNYTIRADNSLALGRLNTDETDNDSQE